MPQPKVCYFPVDPHNCYPSPSTIQSAKTCPIDSGAHSITGTPKLTQTVPCPVQRLSKHAHFYCRAFLSQKFDVSLCKNYGEKMRLQTPLSCERIEVFLRRMCWCFFSSPMCPPLLFFPSCQPLLRSPGCLMLTNSSLYFQPAAINNIGEEVAPVLSEVDRSQISFLVC